MNALFSDIDFGDITEFDWPDDEVEVTSEQKFVLGFFEHKFASAGKSFAITWPNFCESLTAVAGEKDGPCLMLAEPIAMVNASGETYARRRKEYVKRRSLLGLDIELNSKTGEVPPPFAVAIEFLEELGVAYAAWTTHSHREDSPRYRIVVPISPDLELATPEAPRFFADKLALAGVLDQSKLTETALFYLPRHLSDQPQNEIRYKLRGKLLDDGFFAEMFAEIAERVRQEREARAKLQAEFAERSSKFGGAANNAEQLFEAVARDHSITDLLKKHGYKQDARDAERFVPPNSSTGQAGVCVLRDKGKELVYSFNDSCPLADGKAHDAFDVLATFEYGGDRKKAFRELADKYLPKQSQQHHDTRPSAWDGLQEAISSFAAQKTADVDGSDLQDEAVADGCTEITPVPSHDELRKRLPSHAASSKKIPWITASDVTGPILTNNWLIKNVLPADGAGTLYGKPGTGKSFFVLDMALRIALGLEWRGFRTKSVPVTYLSSEAGRMGVNRLYAWFQHNGGSWPANFRMTPASLNLSTEDDAVNLATDILSLQPGCGLVIVDTMARNMGGSDENSSKDMGAFLTNIDKLATITGAFVLLIHHSGKDASKGARGHSSLNGAVGFEMVINREQGEPGIAKVAKLREGEAGAEFGFNLKGVDLGFDQDGDPVSSAVAVSANLEDAKQKVGELIGGTQRAVWAAFLEYVLDHGKPTPIGTGFPDRSRPAVRDIDFVNFATGRLTDVDEKNRKKVVRKTIKDLKAKGRFADNNNLIWSIWDKPEPSTPNGGSLHNSSAHYEHEEEGTE